MKIKKTIIIITCGIIFIGGYFLYISYKNITDKEKHNCNLENNIKKTKGTSPKLKIIENENKDNKHDDKVDTKDIRKIIVIDPGHANRSNLEKESLAPGSSVMKIKDGGGAQGIVTRTPEYIINMKVSMKLKYYLEEKGYEVIMTKTKDSESLGNIERAEIGNKSNALLVIRIHADSSNDSSAKGASILIPAQINENTKLIYDKSKKYASVVLNSLNKEVGINSRGVIERNDMTGFNWSKVPVILIEMGFLSNPDEDKLLSSNEYQDKIVKAIFDGIVLIK